MRLPKLAVRLVTLFLVLSVLLVLVVVVFVGRGLSNELRQLVGASSAEIITENLRTSAIIQFGIGLFIVSIITGVAIWLLVGNPLRRIAEVTERFGVGDLSSRIDADETVDEIRDLALSFNWMAEHLQNVFAEREKHIEELVDAQGSLKISEERLRALIDNSTDIITLLNQDGNITFLSPSAEIILGYRPDEVTGKSIINLIHPEDQPTIANVLNHPTREQSPAAIEIRIRHADKSWRSIEASYAYVSIDEEFRGTLVNARDITQWKELQQQLVQAQKMEALGKLAGGVAHDFNNMLTVIGSYAEMLISDDTDEAHLKWIDEMRRATVRATKVTAQLLAFSRRQVLKPEVMNLNDSVQNLHTMLSRLIGEDVEMVLQLSDDAGPILADPTQIDQVILNLAINAKDAMPEGGSIYISTRSGRMSPNTDTSESCTILEVSDSGHGIDGATIDRIFDPFFTTKDVGKGTGLGLATVQGIIKQSGGTIEVDSTPGDGTSFIIRFPVSNVESNLDWQNLSHGEVHSAGRPYRILVVEDDASILALINLSLQNNGYKVWLAGDAHEALRQIQSEPPFDLLITDIVLPGDMNGADLSDKVEELIPGISVLFMSGYTGDTHNSSAFLRRDRFLLQKPFDRKALLHAVNLSLQENHG